MFLLLNKNEYRISAGYNCVQIHFFNLDWHYKRFLVSIRYFRHAAGSAFVLSKNLAQYININRLVVGEISGMEKSIWILNW